MQTLDILYIPTGTMEADPQPRIRATIKPDNNSIQTRTIMQEDSLRITFQDSRWINFRINDFCIFQGMRYTLFDLSEPEKGNGVPFRYSLVLHGEGYRLKHYRFLFLGIDNTLSGNEFPLNGRAEDFLDLIVRNCNRGEPTWIKGQCVQSDYKHIQFSGENCWDALGRIAAAFGTEFWIEGRTIHLTARQVDTSYTFKQGYQLGLYTIRRLNVDTEKLVTRLYAEGSERNLPPGYRMYSTRLKMFAGQDFIDGNRVQYGHREAYVVFEDVYPHRTGTVTSIDATNPLTFVDFDIDFDVMQQLLPGMKVKVVFQSGQLAAQQFEISNFDFSRKEFTLLKNQNEVTLNLPNETLKPRIGDQYTLVDLQMPQSYLDTAEAELFARAVAYRDKWGVPQLAYSGDMDPTYVRDWRITLDYGYMVQIADDDFGVSRKIRVTSLVRNIVEENRLQPVFSDVLPSPSELAQARMTAANAARNAAASERLAGQVNRRLSA